MTEIPINSKYKIVIFNQHNYQLQEYREIISVDKKTKEKTSRMDWVHNGYYGSSINTLINGVINKEILSSDEGYDELLSLQTFIEGYVKDFKQTVSVESPKAFCALQSRITALEKQVIKLGGTIEETKEEEEDQE